MERRSRTRVLGGHFSTERWGEVMDRICGSVYNHPADGGHTVLFCGDCAPDYAAKWNIEPLIEDYGGVKGACLFYLQDPWNIECECE